jgi:cytochrome c
MRLPAAAFVFLASAGTALAADPAAGEKVFRKCRACHTVEAGGRNLVGPNLHGVLGRAAGAVEGYKYSAAMKESGVVWDRAALDRYLADPRGFVPKNKMAFPGLKDAAERADLIAYLEQASR